MGATDASTPRDEAQKAWDLARVGVDADTITAIELNPFEKLPAEDERARKARAAFQRLLDTGDD